MNKLSNCIGSCEPITADPVSAMRVLGAGFAMGRKRAQKKLL